MLSLKDRKFSSQTFERIGYKILRLSNTGKAISNALENPGDTGCSRIIIEPAIKFCVTPYKNFGNAATLCEEWLQDSEALLQKTANLFYYDLRKILRCSLRIGNLPRAGETILKTVWCLAITSWERRLLWLRLTNTWKCKYRSALETLPKELGDFPKEF